MNRPVLLGDHLGRSRIVGHGPLDRLLGGLVVVLLDLGVVLGQPVDEDATDDHQVVGLVGGNRALGQTICHGLGDALLRRTEHLHGLIGSLDCHLGDHHRRRFHGQVRGEHSQQIDVAGRLIGQGVGERGSNRTILVTDQQIDVGNFIALAHQGFANIKRHVLSPRQV